MNHNAPRYYSQDFEPQASTPLLFFIGCVLACCAFAIGAVAGFEFRDHMAREAEKNKPLQARKTSANPPAFLIGCDRPAIEEVARTCKARMRSGLVGK